MLTTIIGKIKEAYQRDPFATVEYNFGFSLLGIWLGFNWQLSTLDHQPGLAMTCLVLTGLSVICAAVAVFWRRMPWYHEAGAN